VSQTLTTADRLYARQAFHHTPDERNGGFTYPYRELILRDRTDCVLIPAGSTMNFSYGYRFRTPQGIAESSSIQVIARFPRFVIHSFT